MRVAFRRAHGHARCFGDLLERVAERVLQEHDPRLLRGNLGERVAELATQLGVARVAGGVLVGLEMVAERLMGPRLTALRSVEARIHHEAVQPGRELGAAVELLQPHADLRKGLLRGVAPVVGIAQHVAREPLDLRLMAGEQCRECVAIAVLRARHEDRIAQLLVLECRRAA